MAELTFAPVRARRVRIEIYSTGAVPGGGQVALSRLVMVGEGP